MRFCIPTTLKLAALKKEMKCNATWQAEAEYY
jgi:hypothetical protein